MDEGKPRGEESTEHGGQASRQQFTASGNSNAASWENFHTGPGGSATEVVTSVTYSDPLQAPTPVPGNLLLVSLSGSAERGVISLASVGVSAEGSDLGKGPVAACMAASGKHPASLAASAGASSWTSPESLGEGTGPGKATDAPAAAAAAPTSRTGREQNWICAICHNLIPLADTAKISGCDHHYCANCILQWCSYKSYPWCPQCRTPFESLSLFKQLDGSLSFKMVEESVCLLLRATWYVPVEIPVFAEPEDEFCLEEEDYDEDEYYRGTLCIGNRRWGGNGYVRNGRMQARVAAPQASGAESGRRGGGASGSARAASSSGSPAASKGTAQGSGAGMGRRAKRAQKREQADKGTGTTSGLADRQGKGRVA